jgi:hypothetical protein
MQLESKQEAQMQMLASRWELRLKWRLMQRMR